VTLAAHCAPPAPPRGDRRTDYAVALAGNPNTGKSTVFNALTGLRQHTGNWPGKTVARAEGTFTYEGRRYRLIDLPGTYSLQASSTDEEVARDFLLFGEPDVTVVVVDGTRLERNLNLVLQVLEITDRIVVCVNLLDEAKRHGIRIDLAALSRELGVPVVGASARRGEGIRELLAEVDRVATGATVPSPRRAERFPPEIESAVIAAVRTRYPDASAVPYMEAGGTDGLHFRRAGVPTFAVGSLVLRETDEPNYHGMNENLRVDAFYAGLDHWTRIIKALASPAAP